MPSFRERIYAGYDEHLNHDETVRGRALDHFVGRYLPERSARVLDLGCGDGALLRAAMRKGHPVRGIDGSPAMVARAKSLGTPVELGDVLASLPSIESASYECVVAFDVLEHLDNDEQLTLLDHAQRILTPGGRLVLHVPSGEGFFGGAVRYGDVTHVTAFTPSSLNQLFHATGFVKSRFFEERPFAHGFKSAARLVLWHAFRNCVVALNTIETGGYNRGLIVSRNLIAIAHKGDHAALP